MPMIDVYAPAGVIGDKKKLAQELAQTVMRWEKVPVIPFFTENTAAFVHELPDDALSDAGGGGDHVRVQVTTNSRRAGPRAAARRRPGHHRPGRRGRG